MTQAQMVAYLADKVGLSRRQAKSILDELNELVARQLKKKGSLRLAGLGVFHKRKLKARMGRNPATGEQIKIAARTRLRFTPAQALKASVLGARVRLDRMKGACQLPRLELLDNPPVEKSKADEVALEHRARVLEQKLAGFGVPAQVIAMQPGPVVTLYKLEPGERVKVSQIVNLADDLALALRAPAVRILAPIPGEAAVGIEIPNGKREPVYLRELLTAEEFKTAASPLTIALGKDISGRPVWADLAAMPHLLIAGATGTGKSVLIHAMLASILFKATADEVRFILIDPKMLELSVYEGIPHLLVPVVVDPEKAAAALLWATGEMESRYRLMRELSVRNIDSYNRAIQGRQLMRGATPAGSVGNGEPAGAPPKPRRLPKIVIVIDELADLLLS